jgi:hypothetical protein
MSTANPQNGAGSNGQNNGGGGTTLASVARNVSFSHSSQWGEFTAEGVYLLALIAVLGLVIF